MASQVATVDQLSGGRAILAVGVGAVDTGLPDTGEETDKRLRAIRLDEGIDLIRTLWDGGLSYHGQFYDFECDRDDLIRADGRPPGGSRSGWSACGRGRSRCGGCCAATGSSRSTTSAAGPRGRTTPGPCADWLTEHGAPPGLDVVAEGETPADDQGAASAHITPWAQAGCTWWIENRWQMPDGTTDPMAVVSERLAAGPPVAANR